MKPFFLTLIFSTMLFNLNAQSKVFDDKGNSHKIHNEEVDLIFGDINAGVSFPGAVGVQSFSLAALIPTAVDLGFKTISEALKKREQSFTGEYDVQKSNVNVSVAKVPASITFIRKVGLGNKTNSSLSEALKITLSAKPITDLTGAMYFVIDDLKLTYSKARTKQDYNKLDYNISLKLSFLVTDKDGNSEKKAIDLNPIKIPYVAFNSGTPFPVDKYISDIILLPKGGRLAEVSMKIVESNPAKIQAERISALFEEHKDTAKTIINNILPETKSDGGGSNGSKPDGDASSQPDKPVKKGE